MWIKIKLNANQIDEIPASGSSLIKIPNKDKKIWVSKKCIRSLGDWYSSISINETFKYYTNKKDSLSGWEVAELFENQIIQEKEQNIPEIKTIENNEILEDLID